ncbi:MAG: HTH domain-containing protein [Candidatus Aenigmatarchaeota archaeon]
MSEVNYYEVSYPENKEKPEFDTEERRAYILDLILERGHPKLINQSELARQFDVSQTTIWKDLKYISDSVQEHMGEKSDLLFESVYSSVIKELREEGDVKELRKWLKDWSEFLFNRGKVERVPDKVQIEDRRPVEFDLKADIEDNIELEAEE